MYKIDITIGSNRRGNPRNKQTTISANQLNITRNR